MADSADALYRSGAISPKQASKHGFKPKSKQPKPGKVPLKAVEASAPASKGPSNKFAKKKPPAEGGEYGGGGQATQ
jgi:hypothetical protein